MRNRPHAFAPTAGAGLLFCFLSATSWAQPAPAPIPDLAPPAPATQPAPVPPPATIPALAPPPPAARPPSTFSSGLEDLPPPPETHWLAPPPGGPEHNPGAPRDFEMRRGWERRHHRGHRAFFTATYSPLGFVAGNPEGVGHELRLSFGIPAVGGSIGVYFPDQRLVTGLEFLKHWGVSLGSAQKVFLMLPTVEPRLLWRMQSGEPAAQRVALAVGTALTGIRWTEGRWVIDFRVPRLDVWTMPSSRHSEDRPWALSLGASLSLSFRALGKAAP